MIAPGIGLAQQELDRAFGLAQPGQCRGTRGIDDENDGAVRCLLELPQPDIGHLDMQPVMHPAGLATHRLPRRGGAQGGHQIDARIAAHAPGPGWQGATAAVPLLRSTRAIGGGRLPRSAPCLQAGQKVGGQHGLCSFDQHLDRGQVGLVLVVPLIGRFCLFGVGRIGLGVWWRLLRALWELGSAGREDQFNRKCQICLFDTILTHQRSTCPRKRQRLQRCAQRPDSQPGRDFGHFANGAVGHRNAGQKQARLGQCGKIQGKFGRVG